MIIGSGPAAAYGAVGRPEPVIMAAGRAGPGRAGPFRCGNPWRATSAVSSRRRLRAVNQGW